MTGVQLSVRKAAQAALDTMRHARVFLAVRTCMHPDGRALYDEDVKRLAAALDCPDIESGVILVPVEPTDSMIDSAIRAGFDEPEKCWAAMIAALAAPSTPTAKEGGRG